jgi:hypothetical protein
MAENYEFRRLRAIFDSEGSEIREQFILAGLLLTIFERFKKYVVDQVVNAGEKMHRRAGVKMHHGRRHSAATLNSAFQFDQ